MRPQHVEDLAEVGVNDVEIAQPYHSGTRDNPNITVYRTPATGVLYLDAVDRPPENYPPRLGHEQAAHTPDNKRRAQTLFKAVQGRRWCDVGCGTGGLLYALSHVAQRAVGVEPDLEVGRQVPALTLAGVYELEQSEFDVITCMHVFEHVTRPIEFLRHVYRGLEHGGNLILEVPHARDFLIEQSEAFRQHTFWSEHLILHTHFSLMAMLEHVGFTVQRVRDIQRYGLANHMGWLTYGQPRGHQIFPWLDTPYVDAPYAERLAGVRKTDTLWMEARK